MGTNMIFRADRLDQLMVDRGLGNGEVSYLTGISYDMVYKLRRGERPNVSAVVVGQLAEGLKVPLDFFIDKPESQGALNESRVLYEIRDDEMRRRVESLLGLFYRLGERRQLEMLRHAEMLYSIQVEDEAALSAEMRALLDAIESEIPDDAPEVLDQLYNLLEATLGFDVRPLPGTEANLSQDKTQ